MDYKPPDSENERQAAAEPGSVKGSARMPPGAWTSLSTPTRVEVFKNWSDISGRVEANTAVALDQAAQDESDLAATERILVEAEAFGDASENTMRKREITAKQAPSAAASTSDAASSASKAAARALEEATLSTSRAREATSRARDALRASQADFAATNRRILDVGAPAGVYPSFRPRLR